MGSMLEELQRIAESLASRLGRSVAIDDPQFRLLVHTPHGGEVVDRLRVESIMQKALRADVVDWNLSHGLATATAPVRVPAHEDFGFIPRICVPVRRQGVLLAYLWLLGSVTDTDLDQAVESANAAGEVLYRERLLGELRRDREQGLLHDLLAAERRVREDAARRLVAGGDLPEGAETAVFELQVQTAEDRDGGVAAEVALRRVARRLSPLHGLWTGCGRAGGVLLVAGRRPLEPARLAAIAEDLRAETVAAVGEDAIVGVGVGSVVAAIEMAHESRERAQSALRVAARVRRFGAVVAWDSLGIYRLLVRLRRDQFGADAVPDGLVRLLETDHSGVLGETLEVYLDEAGRAAAAIERLQIHRTSLYHRLNRIEEITGMSLSSGEDRLALHLGVKLVRLGGPRS
jgi:hypothetical protein